ncbi:MAG: tRNA (guanosine(46)-N7)-methyltransferase TrmB [Limisphaerales bacterium]
MNTEISAPAVSSLVYPLASIVERLDLARLFANQQLLEVELGSGDGSFLAQYAALHPERNFIGVERLLGRLRKLDRKGQRLNLANLRLLRIEASYFLDWLLPPRSIHALHVYFPDPWPKRKHQRHRLINERFPKLAGQALAAGGAVYLRTDDADYFSRMTKAFAACPSFKEVPTPEALAAVMTDFERGFLRRGVPTLRAAYQFNGP